MADSAGIPHAIGEEVLIAPYNDLATTEALIAAHHNELAAVIVEPYQRVIVPQPGFLTGLRAVTQRYGVPLVFDEIVTGFRLAYGGAQEYYGVVPDVAAFGKVLAGGFPLARGGRPRGHHAALRRRAGRHARSTCGRRARSTAIRWRPSAGLATLAELRKPGAYDEALRHRHAAARRAGRRRAASTGCRRR